MKLNEKYFFSYTGMYFLGGKVGSKELRNERDLVI